MDWEEIKRRIASSPAPEWMPRMTWLLKFAHDTEGLTGLDEAATKPDLFTDDEWAHLVYAAVVIDNGVLS